MDLKTKTLVREINRLFWNSGKTVSTAESCSAGRLAEVLSDVPGSSAFFRGGVVCYTDEMKIRHLHVSEEVLKQKTAVCEEVAAEMVKGALEMFGTDYAVSMTGVAGPTGAMEENPVGSIWVAYGSRKEIATFHFQKNLGRDRNVDDAVYKTMLMFKDYIKKELDK